MTQAKLFAARVGGRVGLGEEAIIAIILALIQSAPLICPVNTPRRLRRAVRLHPDALEEQVRLVHSHNANGVAAAITTEIEMADDATLATVLRELRG